MRLMFRDQGPRRPHRNPLVAAALGVVLLVLAFVAMSETRRTEDRLRIAVVGLTHTHVHWLLGREDRGDIEIVGIVEPDRELAKRYTSQYGMSMDLVFDSFDELLESTDPEAAAAFGSIHEHLGVVETAAPLGIHVMVEKPLAVNMTHARRMQTLAEEHDIHLLTNYETTWYGSTHMAAEILANGKLGPLRKAVFNHGHEGPKKIGINKEFLDWLADPEQNGGGAIVDFGCYGANLMTWLMQGERPESVTAVTAQFQPGDYPQVDDEATIIISYPEAQAIVQASWNWPISRKDMVLYGTKGYVAGADER